MSIYDDSFIPGWKKLVDAVHQYDTKILSQLFHPAYMAFPVPGTPQLIALSHVGPYYAKAAPRPATVSELHTIVRQFGEAAGRFQKAGGDGVEIQAAHAHGLPGGFLTPLYNKRTDDYGGDINGRLRLTLEVIREVRKICGEDFLIDVRISGDEYTDGGLTLNDMIYVSRQLEAAGVEIRTGCEVTADMIAAESDGYEIICAYKAVPKEIAAYKCFRQTMTAGDVLSGKGFPGRKVVIPGGGSVGCETADYLAPLIDDRFPANRDVTIIELTNTLMATEGGAAKSMLTQRLMRKGVHILSECMVTKVDETTITYEKNGQEYVIADADTLIFAVGYTPLPVAYEPVRLIGDCEKAGNLKDAISAAYTYARNL